MATSLSPQDITVVYPDTVRPMSQDPWGDRNDPRGDRNDPGDPWGDPGGDRNDPLP